MAVAITLITELCILKPNPEQVALNGYMQTFGWAGGISSVVSTLAVHASWTPSCIGFPVIAVFSLHVILPPNVAHVT